MIGIDQIEVRPSSPEDGEVLAAIWLETAELLAAADPRFALAPDGVKQWRDAFALRLNDPDRAYFTAIRRGHAVGFLAIGVQDNPGYGVGQTGLVYELCIDSHGRGGGVGAKLWEAATAWFQARQIVRVEVRIPTQHAIAQAFWRATGARAWYDHLSIKL
jgi:GNAT superfamily N-acetyltransferase